MNRNIFITGTNTDVGKTYISGLLVKYLRENGENVGYYKPALSGAENINSVLVPGDSKVVCEMGDLNEMPRNLVSYIYENPVSPHLAGKIENNPVTLEKIKADYDFLNNKYERLIVEGSGGIACPLRYDNEKIMLEDIVSMLKLDVILVSNSSLGQINNVILSYEYMKNRNINVLGVILNNYDDSDLIKKDNKYMIKELTNLNILGCVKEGDTNITPYIEI